MSSESELLKALEAISKNQQADPEIEYRFYYNEHGDVVCCSMITPYPDLPNYIVVNKEQYNNYHRYRVVNGHLQLIIHNAGVRNNLIKVDAETKFKVVAGQPALLVEPSEHYQDIDYYDYRIN